MNKLKIYILVIFVTFCGCSIGNPRYNPLLKSSVVARWSTIAADASGYDHSMSGYREKLGPTKSSYAQAIVHLAIYDAINSVTGQRYEPYALNEIVSGASIEATVARAAHDALLRMFPAQRVQFKHELMFDLNKIPNEKAKKLGLLVGSASARAIFANRINDGYETHGLSKSYIENKRSGYWRRDPTNPDQIPYAPHWSKVRPFVLKSASQFRAPPPPDLSSLEYAQAYSEVLNLGGDGISTPTNRTEDQTQAGIYWAYDGTPKLCAPPRLYNQIALQIAKEQGVTDLVELARLLAIVNVGMADAGIAAWETKYYYNFWRPITAIRESDPGTGPTQKGDGNKFTKGDRDWTPLGAPATYMHANNFTPPFPAYVSGHAAFGGVLFQALRRFFQKDDISFTFVSDELDGTSLDNKGKPRQLRPRSFSSLTQAEEENGQSRIYLGIHWSFDKTEGIKMGNKISDWIFDNTFRPTKNN